MRRQVSSVAVIALLLGGGLAAPAAAQPDDDPELAVRLPNFSGDGSCHSGNTLIALDPKTKVLEFIFTDLTARYGHPVDDHPLRRCYINLHLHWGLGHTVAITDISHEGSTALPPRGSATLTVGRHWWGDGNTERVTKRSFSGPLSGPFAFPAEIPQPPVYAPCGQTSSPGGVSVTAQVSSAANDSELAVTRLRYQLSTKAC